MINLKNKELEFKLSYVPGLRDVVFDEIKNKINLKIINEGKDSFYVDYFEDFENIKKLKSVSRSYLVIKNKKYNPLYISNHKSIVGNLIEIVINKNDKGAFKKFKINCAGSNTTEILEIKEYIKSMFKMEEAEESDLKISIAKVDDVWEIALQTTPRPLSYRDYKVENMSGAMNPNVAYSLNYLCSLEKYKTYLNIFSGSATLMVEAGLNYGNLDKIVGFDSNKKHLSLSIKNIKNAGLIKKAEVKEFNIFDNPKIGKFDVITSDLPFGMSISKGEDLKSLYKTFIEYCEETLNKGGKLGVYTSEFKIFENLIFDSKFKIEKDISIDLITNENEYLPVKIIVLSLY